MQKFPAVNRLKSVFEITTKLARRIYKGKNYVLAVLVLFVGLWLNSWITNRTPLPPDIINDVVYDSTKPEYCLGDIYQPSRPKHSVSPAVIIVHGGGWESGSKNDGSTGAIVSKLLESGFVVFNINYRLESEDGRFPHNLDDVNKAIDFLFLNASQYGVDSNNVSILGISAGAHLALLAAYSENKTSNGLRAVVAIAPATDLTKLNSIMITKYFPPTDPNRQKLASPLDHADFAISTMLIHGTADQVVPFSQSQLLAAALSRLHKPVKILSVKGGDHNFIVAPGKDQDEADIEIVDF